uniref:FYVE-type domain-containing protein n=1 Tax=Panagrellus redivivus TaxID=6233 RepID=A0A7E4VYH1_PANRE
MPCSNCMEPYTVFRKEVGCSKCTYGFCPRCCSNKMVIPKLSSKPVTVCNSCYATANATANGHVPGPRLQDVRDRGMSNVNQKQWWGDDELPPPSMRRDYKKQLPAPHRPSGGGGGGGQRVPTSSAASSDPRNAEVNEIEARLARLKGQHVDEIVNPRIAITGKTDNGEVPTGRGVLDSFIVDENPIPTSGRHPKSTATITDTEIEERLARLRGVPVEEIRKPRKFIMDDEDMDSDVDLPDEALQLLAQAERQTKQLGGAYVNHGLDVDSNRESATSLDSMALKKIVNECENMPSADASLASYQYPNFVEEFKKTRDQVKQAEKDARKFIKEHSVDIDNEDDESVPPPVHIRPSESARSHDKEPILSPKSAKGFFSKLFRRSPSKDHHLADETPKKNGKK